MGNEIFFCETYAEIEFVIPKNNSLYITKKFDLYTKDEFKVFISRVCPGISRARQYAENIKRLSYDNFN